MPDDNMRIWDAVSKTDPAHTKPVEFGRKFTSIDAHWQIQQATKLFGPVGAGWGYVPAHGVITLTPEIILAVADVTIWWMDTATVASRHTYGPIRATCEMYAPKTKFGKIIPGEFVTDEDAPKKAMTDALTKGLSHLGFSADVFLGLFDDNRYVAKMKKEFADNHPGTAQTKSLAVDPADAGMVQGDGDNQYKADKFKAAIAAGWKTTNKTPAGRDNQILAYLDMAISPDHISAILKANEEHIATSERRDDINDSADKILQWFTDQTAKGQAA